MIKLAASDLDGTLLDSSGRLPSEIFPLIEELYEKGITFCAASGRQLVSLEKLFAPVRDKIIFIAGGTQVTPELAVKAGADAGFGRGSKGIHNATFIVKERRRRRGEES